MSVPPQAIARRVPVSVPIATWGGVAISPDGRVAVWNQIEERVDIFESIDVGGPGASVGAYGKGPGEFETVSAMGWLDSALWVLDASNGNLLRATPPEWRVVTTRVFVPLTVEMVGENREVLGSVRLVGRLSTDEFVLAGMLSRTDPAAVKPGAEDTAEFAVVAWNPVDNHIRTIVVDRIVPCLRTHRMANRIRTQRVPFCETPQVIVDPVHGIALTVVRVIKDARREVVSRVASSGDLNGLTECRDTISAPAVDPELFAEVRGALKRQEGRTGRPNLVRSSDIPKYHARLRGGGFDGSGEFWTAVESVGSNTVVLHCGGPGTAKRRLEVGPVTRVVGALHGRLVALVPELPTGPKGEITSTLVWVGEPPASH